MERRGVDCFMQGSRQDDAHKVAFVQSLHPHCDKQLNRIDLKVKNKTCLCVKK